MTRRDEARRLAAEAQAELGRIDGFVDIVGIATWTAALDIDDEWDEWTGETATIDARIRPLLPPPPADAEEMATKPLREVVAYALDDERWLTVD